MPNSSAHEIESLEPKLVWQIFAGIAAVPRPSKKEERIRQHLKDAAARHKFALREDKVGNMVISVPATPGCEHAPIIVLQGHIDMVCEKNADTQHDFDNDPIRMVLDKHDGERIVRADGTTLGADNGIGVALALAAATSPDVKHGPLELLLTIDEEAGMTGAKALEGDLFNGRIMLNLDSEEDDVIYIGCAGGCDTTLAWEFASEPVAEGAEICRVIVRGLRGGHSGGDIHLNRGNAVKLLARTLGAVPESALQLAELNGGSLRNAIPREASAVVVGLAGTVGAISRTATQVESETIEDAGESDCEILVEVIDSPKPTAVISREATRRVLLALTGLPNGVLAVVPEIAGLVETSNNVATVRMDRAKAAGSVHVTVGCLSRSSVESSIDRAVRQIRAVGELSGASVDVGNDYPGWRPNVDSPVLAACRKVYEEQFDEAPNVTAIHAGLECGIIGKRVEGMDMVSFGPHIEGAHSPDERVYVDSVAKSWQYLKAVLARLADAD